MIEGDSRKHTYSFRGLKGIQKYSVVETDLSLRNPSGGNTPISIYPNLNPIANPNLKPKP